MLNCALEETTSIKLSMKPNFQRHFIFRIKLSIKSNIKQKLGIFLQHFLSIQYLW